MKYVTTMLRTLTAIVCLVGVGVIALLLAGEGVRATISVGQETTTTDLPLAHLQPNARDLAKGDSDSMTTANSRLVEEVQARPSTRHGPPSHYTPGATLIGPHAHRKFTDITDAEQELSVSIRAPSYLPDGVSFASVKEVPNGGGTALIYHRSDTNHGVLIIRGGVSIKAGGLRIKSGQHSEVSLSSGGRAALIRGSWRGSSWDAEAALTAVVENANAEKFLVYAIPAVAWTMEEIQRVVDSL